MSSRVVEIIEAGRVGYTDALAWQRDLAHARIEGRVGHDLLLLLEHPPVITLGRNANRRNVVNSADIPVVDIERGGDVTLHAPGQLVAYPILDLQQYRPDLHWYLRTLEQTLIEALQMLGISAERRPPHTGVWTGGRKIASIGIHVKQWVTWHGFALNVTTEVAQFRRIVPCGITGVEMTTIAREHPTAESSSALWSRAVNAVVVGFEHAFSVQTVKAHGAGTPRAPATHDTHR